MLSIKTQKKIRFWLFTLLILLAPLSKYPSFGMPIYNFTSFRIGLYQLLATAFIVSCLFGLSLGFLKINKLATTGFGLLTIPTIFGFAWAVDSKRWFLMTISLVILLALAITAWWYIQAELTKPQLKKILRLAIYASIIYSVLVIFQFLFNTFSKDDLGILCLNCTNTVFGFPRVNLFTAEPQFLANSLLPFLFILLHGFISSRSKLVVTSLALASLAIGLTFSRGAFFALAVSLFIFYTATLLTKKIKLKSIVLSALVIVTSIIVSFGLLLASASYTYKNTPNITYNTAKTMLEQLSLGLIVLPAKAVQTQPQQQNSPNNNFQSPGLIAASTNDRLSAGQLAIKTWSHNAKNVLVGVGPGNLGPYTVKYINPTAPPNLTVYIYYVLILVELGLVGLAGLILLFVSTVYKLSVALHKTKNPVLPLFIAILVAFFVQYFFFGSYINVVYVWLWLGIGVGLASLSYKQLSKLLDKEL